MALSSRLGSGVKQKVTVSGELPQRERVMPVSSKVPVPGIVTGSPSTRSPPYEGKSTSSGQPPPMFAFICPFSIRASLNMKLGNWLPWTGRKMVLECTATVWQGCDMGSFTS